MSSNRSRRRVLPPDEDEDDELPDDPEDCEVFEEDVEYFVDVELVDSVRTSVPKLLQLSQSCNSAPSTFVVVSDGLSAPHISHWGMLSRSVARGIKRTPRCRPVIGRESPRRRRVRRLRGPTTHPRIAGVQ